MCTNGTVPFKIIMYTKMYVFSVFLILVNFFDDLKATNLTKFPECCNENYTLVQVNKTLKCKRGDEIEKYLLQCQYGAFQLTPDDLIGVQNKQQDIQY